MSDVLRLRYVIGLGANLGDRLGTLKLAVLALGAIGEVERLSHVYETPALGPPQPDYLNAAALVRSNLSPRALLDELLRIEQRHGRERRERWGPRTLDLDLLLSPGLTLEEPGLSLPHPELGRRSFALVPLLDVLPDARDELSGASYAALLTRLESTPLRRFATSESWDPRTSA
jgi:2-amino-4-hydroxy-6-hydroxymethyldihydropteridine diphosphokinase